MNTAQHVTDAIVLTRTDYGEADRIITMLTPDQGKLRLMAKGVRRVKSKLAGGIELFSVTNITYIKGRGDIGTLVSARLQVHYGHIVQDISRTMLGYELIKQLHKATEDEPEADYFHLLHRTFVLLDDSTVSTDLIRLWFGAQFLRLSGHMPNLYAEPDGTKLAVDKAYEFSFDDSAFIIRPGGVFAASDIKLLRIIFSDSDPQLAAHIQGVDILVKQSLQLVTLLLRRYIQ